MSIVSTPELPVLIRSAWSQREQAVTRGDQEGAEQANALAIALSGELVRRQGEARVVDDFEADVAGVHVIRP